MTVKLVLRMILFFILLHIGYSNLVAEQFVFPNYLIGMVCVVSAILLILSKNNNK